MAAAAARTAAAAMAAATARLVTPPLPVQQARRERRLEQQTMRWRQQLPGQVAALLRNNSSPRFYASIALGLSIIRFALRQPEERQQQRQNQSSWLARSRTFARPRACRPRFIYCSPPVPLVIRVSPLVCSSCLCSPRAPTNQELLRTVLLSLAARHACTTAVQHGCHTRYSTHELKKQTGYQMEADVLNGQSSTRMIQDSRSSYRYRIRWARRLLPGAAAPAAPRGPSAGGG